MRAGSLVMLAILSGTVCLVAASPGVFSLLKGLGVAVVYGSCAADTDFEAALMLADLAAELGCKVSLVEDSELSKLDVNLIVVGGPAVNKVAEELNFKLGVGFRRSRGGWVLLVDRPRRAFRGRDVGFVLASKLSGRVIIWVAGVAREGTAAAARYLAEHYSEVKLGSLTLVKGERVLEAASLTEEAERTVIKLTVYYFYSILRRYRGPWIGADETTRIYIWCIPPDLEEGWYIVWDASPSELPIAGIYNTVWLVRKFNSDAGTALVRLGRYYMPSDSTVIAELDRSQGVHYSIRENSYIIYWRTGLIPLGVQHSIPWTSGEMSFEIRPAKTPGAFALYIYRMGEVIACDLLVNVTRIEVNLGPDGKPTILELEVVKACPDARCISLVFKLKAKGPVLNVSELGDDLNLTQFLYILWWDGKRLLWAKTPEIEVPSWLPNKAHVNITDDTWLTVADPSKLED